VHPFDKEPDPFANPAQTITDELPVRCGAGKIGLHGDRGFSDHKSTAVVWYKLLNLGFRIPAGAGTDATANYARTDSQPSGQGPSVCEDAPRRSMHILWILVRGAETRPDVRDHGPLLEFGIGNALVGDDLQLKEPQTIAFKARLRSIVPVDRLEVVCNGRVAKEIAREGNRQSANTEGTLPILR
jgi:hypothetical protein